MIVYGDMHACTSVTIAVNLATLMQHGTIILTLYILYVVSSYYISYASYYNYYCDRFSVKISQFKYVSKSNCIFLFFVVHES